MARNLECKTINQQIITDMKKYFTLMVLTIFGGLLMMSCEMNEVVDRDIQDNDTYPVMKDVTGNF